MNIVDVSSNNGIIDWNAFKSNSDIFGIMIKANEGYLCADKQLALNAQGAFAAGFPVGYYHFATLNTTDIINDAEQEANYFLKSLVGLPNPGLPLALDIETNAAKLSASQVILWAKTFINTLKASGITNLALYSGLSFLNSNHFSIIDFPNVKIWVAAYSSVFVLPKGFDQVWAWQYTAEGSLLGIKGNVDLSKLVS